MKIFYGFTMKNFTSLIIGFFLVLILWYIFIGIGNIGNSIQFQEVSLNSRGWLYFTIVIVLIIWIYCIFKYFKPPKKVKRTKPFAKPSGKNYRTALVKEGRPFLRTFLLLGTIIGIIVSFSLMKPNSR